MDDEAKLAEQILTARVEERKRVTGRECGTCNLCCKVMPIDVEGFHKPHSQWCQHARPRKGCGIYADRPGVCRSWACQWLTDPTFGPDWFPLRSKIVIAPIVRDDVEGPWQIQVHVDPGYPNAWKKEPFFSAFQGLAKQMMESRAGTVTVFVGGKSWLILPNKVVPGPDPDDAYVVLQQNATDWELINFGKDHGKAGKFLEFQHKMVDAMAGVPPELRKAVGRDMMKMLAEGRTSASGEV